MSGDAHDSDFAFEVLQGGNLAVATAVLPISTDVLRVCARSHPEVRRDQRNRDGGLAVAALPAVLRRWLRSGEVVWVSTRSDSDGIN